MRRWWRGVFLLFTVNCCAVAGENKNLTLLSHLHRYQGYNDCWGYTAPDDREYAIIAAIQGVSIVDVSDPANPVEVAFVDGPFSGWRDMKTYQHYLYVCTEASTQIQIVDLAGLPDSVRLVGTYSNLDTTPHNIFIDVGAGVLYAIEDGNTNRPVRLISLANPEQPSALADLGRGLGTDAHDVFAQDGVLYVAEGSNGTLGIFDVRDPANPRLVRRVTIPAAGYVHNVWASSNNRFLVSTEETVGRTVKLWDISDLDNIDLIDEYLGESQLAHNALIKGNLFYLSHYRSGLKVLDISDPEIIVEVGSYDTFPSSDSPGFAGAWGTYPYTANGTIFISDMQTGLYVVSYDSVTVSRMRGFLTDAETGQPIADGWIEVQETGKVLRTNSSGVFKLGVTGEANFTLSISALGFQSQTMPVSLASGQVDTIAVSLQRSARGSVIGSFVDNAGEPVSGVEVTLRLQSVFFTEPQIIKAISGSDGAFAFLDLPVSDGTFANYDSLWAEPIFPFSSYAAAGPIVTTGAPSSLRIELEPADVLLVNDDPAGNYASYYTMALDSLGFSHHKINLMAGENVPASKISLLNASIVVWFTGNASALTKDKQDSLRVIIDNGGKLLLTGQNIAEGLSTKGTEFLSNYLHVEYGGLAVAPIANPVSDNPVTGNLLPIATAGSEGANNQTSRDILRPLPGGRAVAALSYLGAPDDAAAVTIVDANGNPQIVFLGFGFEAIVSNNTRTTNRAQFMERVLGWFAGTTNVTDQPAESPASFELLQNYPNPFNPVTTIGFALARAEHVSLRIYDGSGRLVRTLTDEILPAGQHRLVWNGTADSGARVASGLYVYRINTPNWTGERKLLLLK